MDVATCPHFNEWNSFHLKLSSPQDPVSVIISESALFEEQVSKSGLLAGFWYLFILTTPRVLLTCENVDNLENWYNEF